ncbi:MAG: TRAP transporter small permease [Rhodospirillales bacterium]
MIARFVTHLEEGVVSLLLVVMTLVVFVEVVLRFAFNTGMIWADELVLHLSAWMVLLGASYGVKVGSHIGVDAVVRLLPTGARRAVTLLAIVLCLIYCGLFIQGSWVYLQKVYRIGLQLEDLPIEKWGAHSILLIGFVLLAIRFVLLGWHVLQGKSDTFGFADEAKEALETLGTDATFKEEARKP